MLEVRSESGELGTRNSEQITRIQGPGFSERHARSENCEVKDFLKNRFQGFKGSRIRDCFSLEPLSPRFLESFNSDFHHAFIHRSMLDIRFALDPDHGLLNPVCMILYQQKH
jgi:hypothetical protein